MKNIYGISLVGLVAILLSSCAPAVEVVGEWKNPDAEPTQDIDKVMVTAMVSNEQAKRAFEDALEKQLQQTEVAATKGHVVFPTMFSEQFENNREKMLQKIKETENDAILTVNLLDKDTEARYVPGTTAGPYRPMVNYNWYGNFWGYYNYYYPTVYDPGYYSTTQVYYLEANFYDAESEELLWSAQTEVYDPTQLEEFASEFAKEVIGSLTGEGLLVTDPDRM